MLASVHGTLEPPSNSFSFSEEKLEYIARFYLGRKAQTVVLFESTKRQEEKSLEYLIMRIEVCG